MRFSSTAAAGIASLCLLMTSASSDASSPTRAVVRPRIDIESRRAVQSNPNGHEVRRRFAATTCSTQGTDAFVGVNNANVAGGQDSAVVDGADNEACDEYSGIGAGMGNAIGNGGSATLSFIAAGDDNTITGNESFVGAGAKNDVSGGASFIGAGANNVASGSESVVVGGSGNTAGANFAAVVDGIANSANGANSFIGSGDSNTVGGNYAAIGSGLYNVAAGDGSFVGAGGYDYEFSNNDANFGKTNNSASGNDSFIGAGDENTVASDESFIGSGLLNSIGSNDTYSIITGGYGNVVGSAYGTIDGGESNKVMGAFGTIPGGAHNQALGTLSFAAGYQAQANHAGSFVWSDYVSGASPLADTNVDQFVVRAAGGTFVYSSENLASGVKLAAGSGTWSSLSDRNAKTEIVPVDDDTILTKVAALPVSTWRYKTEKSVRHVGPMAQDFYSAFGVGEDDRHVTSIDEDGVALAAIKALRSRLAALATRDAALEARGAELERRLDRLSSSHARVR